MDMEKAAAAIPLPASLAVSLQGRVTDDTLLQLDEARCCSSNRSSSVLRQNSKHKRAEVLRHKVTCESRIMYSCD